VQGTPGDTGLLFRLCFGPAQGFETLRPWLQVHLGRKLSLPSYSSWKNGILMPRSFHA